MPFKKDLAERLYRISKFSSQSLTSCRITSSSVQTRIQKRSSEASISPDPGDHGMFRRLFHRKAIFQPEILPMQIGEKLKDKLKAFDVTKDRIRLDRFFPPEMWKADKEGLTIEGTRKLLRVAQLELMKSRLRQMDKTWITYSEFVQTIGEVCSDPEQAKGVANTLDESGSVLVIGDVVYLKPEKVVKVIGGLIPLPVTNPNDPRRKELKQMEKQKAEIDQKARTLVRRELWCGLGFLVVQTFGFMRLTFWELSWDIMEPICFYVTSMYFMAGYAFFLRTSKEPSFEGFYQSRFSDKQRQLMKLQNFDLERYTELRKICDPYSSSSEQLPSSVIHLMNTKNLF
ncbi:hypothetical protein K2173_006129 [Erythroxylum novogranatense]|uniref:Calcium uniporter protein C-terminal domain-containing protein n=1 Tax=Erythroxylum novogranatense TaxID=1862640 RepID=A0AAV8TDX1_9ROSI|nr:hypothetical protein K2173_006129 [Erythroxylum novogranatense]